MPKVNQAIDELILANEIVHRKATKPSFTKIYRYHPACSQLIKENTNISTSARQTRCAKSS
ncbi:hypothetical protein CAter282_4060 [Collimonas arenae]|uniref:Uncharacterized protein n=1 Tax=Collimonas arenae TaxID=279058 RepID=A0A127QPF9_9BURK|nr:hypothetical protein CAter282_4060 [Collimonas arenae]